MAINLELQHPIRKNEIWVIMKHFELDEYHIKPIFNKPNNNVSLARLSQHGFSAEIFNGITGFLRDTISELSDDVSVCYWEEAEEDFDCFNIDRNRLCCQFYALSVLTLGWVACITCYQDMRRNALKKVEKELKRRFDEYALQVQEGREWKLSFKSESDWMMEVHEMERLEKHWARNYKPDTNNPYPTLGYHVLNEKELEFFGQLPDGKLRSYGPGEGGRFAIVITYPYAIPWGACDDEYVHGIEQQEQEEEEQQVDAYDDGFAGGEYSSGSPITRQPGKYNGSEQPKQQQRQYAWEDPPPMYSEHDFVYNGPACIPPMPQQHQQQPQPQPQQP